MLAKEDNKRIEYWFINTEGDRISIWPIMEILSGAFIQCIDLKTGQQLTIHRNRIKWDKV